MTNEELKKVQEIQGTAGFRIMQSLIAQKLDQLDRVSTLDYTSDAALDYSARARQETVKFLSEFLKEINLIPKEEKETKRTYE